MPDILAINFWWKSFFRKIDKEFRRFRAVGLLAHIASHSHESGDGFCMCNNTHTLCVRDLVCCSIDIQSILVLLRKKDRYSIFQTDTQQHIKKQHTPRSIMCTRERCINSHKMWNMIRNFAVRSSIYEIHRFRILCKYIQLIFNISLYL